MADGLLDGCIAIICIPTYTHRWDYKDKQFFDGNKFLLWSPSQEGWYEVLGVGVRGVVWGNIRRQLLIIIQTYHCMAMMINDNALFYIHIIINRHEFLMVTWLSR